jgi:nitroreductase
MDLMQAIVTRRAVREYNDMPVEQARIEQCIHAASLAPSAMNRQPWAFAVLTDPERIEDHARRAKLWLLKNLKTNPALASLKPLLEKPDYSVLHGAPVLAFILATSHEPQTAEDCCLAAQNFMLAAREEDLGTCWIGLARDWFNQPAVKKELHLPEKYQVVAPIVLGHPKHWPSSPARHPVEIHWIG